MAMTLANTKSNDKLAKQAREYLSRLTNREIDSSLKNLSDSNAKALYNIAAKPFVRARVNHSVAPFGLTLFTSYGSVMLDDSLQHINNVYVNGQEFSVNEQGIDAISKLTGSENDVKSVLDEPIGRQKRGRRTRSRKYNENLPFKEIQNAAYDDMKHVKFTYDSLFSDLNGLLDSTNIDSQDVADELFANKVDEKDIAHFLVYDSQYKNDIISAAYGVNMGAVKQDYNFQTQKQDDTFAGKLLKRLNVDQAQYDPKAGVMQIGNRQISNLPYVDKNGVFESGGHKYLPYHIGYFKTEEGSRVSRLRVMDPVQNAIDAVALQYEMSGGDVRFKTLLDVTRNLPDFDKHPYGKEILDTMKKKVVLDKSYGKSNSLLADFNGQTDELGATALTMLDDDAKGLIDPLGTSNGANMGKIFYLTEKSQINPDGTLTPGGDDYSPVGKILSQYHVDRDNFNRNQMSFNAFLTSTDVKELNVCYSEFAMWNSEDAVVMTKHGAEKAFDMEKKCGDKVEDFHGNKSTISLIADPDMPKDEAKNKHVEWANAFAEMNPHLDLIVSPVSLASRLNMGVPHEALTGEKHDLYLPNGKTVKDGMAKVMYMSLPQTAEHKSKDYSLEGDGRRYSTLIHYALASKVGEDLYDKALIDDNAKQQHIDEVNTAFNRLGISFDDPDALIKKGNVQDFVDSPAEIDKDDFSLKTPQIVRAMLQDQMEDGQININLGDTPVISPLTGKPITDSFDENVLPIRVEKGETIPYRYNDVFKALANGNNEHLQMAFEKATANDYRNLTKKDNLLKNIDTMRFSNEAHTDVLTPDPTLPLKDIRNSIKDKQVIIHRDPVIQSGNAISMDNIGHGNPNTVQVNPLIEVMMDADNDGDTLGVVGYSNLNLNDKEKKEFFNKSSMVEQVNQYGRVFLETDNSHFVAAAKANNLDISNVNFDDGKSNQELVDLVDNLNKKIVASPESYGAYALSFENDQSLKDSLGKLADDDIKGDKNEIDHVFDNGYTQDENRAILKALIAKSEWTGLAGATTNNLISGLSSEKFDPALTRVSLDVTHTMTQSVLQMKKNADKLPEIDRDIKEMKAVMAGRYGKEESRAKLKQVTDGLLEPEAIDKFVDIVSNKQTDKQDHFGRGVLNATALTTTKIAFNTQAADLGKALLNISEKSDGLSQ